jgi:hypothetical protein
VDDGLVIFGGVISPLMGDIFKEAEIKPGFSGRSGHFRYPHKTIKIQIISIRRLRVPQLQRRVLVIQLRSIQVCIWRPTKGKEAFLKLLLLTHDA